MRNYGYDSVKMANNLTQAEILQLISELESDPKNQTPPATGWFITKSARNKISSCAMAIYFLQGGYGRAPRPE